jgi:FAD/FMN-containing dehydrogenase
MKAIEVDVSAKTVRVEPGVTLGEIDAATQAHGLATPLGGVSQTGIAGLTLGGGIGWLRRKHGLAADNVLSFEVVTADGRLVTAGESENADLYWGPAAAAPASASSPRSSIGFTTSAPR